MFNQVDRLVYSILKCLQFMRIEYKLIIMEEEKFTLSRIQVSRPHHWVKLVIDCHLKQN